jgi:hypothetical protein
VPARWCKFDKLWHVRRLQLQLYLYVFSLAKRLLASLWGLARMDLRHLNDLTLVRPNYPSGHAMHASLTAATARVVRVLSSPGSTSDMGPLRKARGPSSNPRTFRRNSSHLLQRDTVPTITLSRCRYVLAYGCYRFVKRGEGASSIRHGDNG